MKHERKRLAFERHRLLTAFAAAARHGRNLPLIIRRFDIVTRASIQFNHAKSKEPSRCCTREARRKERRARPCGESHSRAPNSDCKKSGGYEMGEALDGANGPAAKPDQDRNSGETANPMSAKVLRMPTCRPLGEHLDKVTDLLRAIAAERGRPLFALVSRFIDEDILDEVYTWKRELRETGRSVIDVLIDSPGGSLTSCYMIARLMARWTNSWEALIPTYAASGATLICLGSSRIVMAERAQLARSTGSTSHK